MNAKRYSTTVTTVTRVRYSALGRLLGVYRRREGCLGPFQSPSPPSCRQHCSDYRYGEAHLLPRRMQSCEAHIDGLVKHSEDHRSLFHGSASLSTPLLTVRCFVCFVSTLLLAYFWKHSPPPLPYGLAPRQTLSLRLTSVHNGYDLLYQVCQTCHERTCAAAERLLHQ